MSACLIDAVRTSLVIGALLPLPVGCQTARSVARGSGQQHLKAPGTAFRPDSIDPQSSADALDEVFLAYAQKSTLDLAERLGSPPATTDFDTGVGVSQGSSFEAPETSRIELTSIHLVFAGPTPAGEIPPPPPAEDPDPIFPGQAVLPLDGLVSEVLRRNPTMQVAVAAWQAASQRYPQDVAFDDPMFLGMLGPQGLAANQINGAYVVGVSQKVPWHGKRQLRGQMALWEQTASQWDTHDVGLQLTEAAKVAYYEYYLVYRELEVNTENTSRTEEFRDTARSRYEAGQVPQQDMLQAEVELGQLERRRLELTRQKQVAVARLNTLMHRRPDFPLLPPPTQLNVTELELQTEVLQQMALESRPDLTALSARIQAERSAVELACKEFYPDFDFMARYDAFWQERPLRPMIGMNMNVPLNHDKRHAAVNEAMFRMQKLTAEYAQKSDAIRNDVQAASAMLNESRSLVQLYEQKIIPAAEANVASAEAGYAAGRIDFLRLIEAQRQLIDLSEQRHQAVAAYYTRRAELERIVGRTL